MIVRNDLSRQWDTMRKGQEISMLCIVVGRGYRFIEMQCREVVRKLMGKFIATTTAEVNWQKVRGSPRSLGTTNHRTLDE